MAKEELKYSLLKQRQAIYKNENESNWEKSQNPKAKPKTRSIIAKIIN
ncbi:hypothetical protein [Candidatus Protochlamydia sp. W-9]|nr:hypothetical protein [Candidatus Protochlamydia sp. W-9]